MLDPCLFVVTALILMTSSSGIPPRTSGPTSCKWCRLLPLCSRLALIACSEGDGRVTLFAANGNARTFNYQVSHISYPFYLLFSPLVVLTPFSVFPPPTAHVPHPSLLNIVNAF